MAAAILPKEFVPRAEHQSIGSVFPLKDPKEVGIGYIEAASLAGWSKCRRLPIEISVPLGMCMSLYFFHNNNTVFFQKYE